MDINDIGIEICLKNKRALEKKLALAEKRYQLLMENASCGFFIHDSDGTVLDINKACVKIFGEDKSNIINKNFRQYVIPEEKEYVKVQLSKLKMDKHIGPNICHILQANSVIRIVEFSGVTVESDDDVLYLSIINDITERTRIHDRALLAAKLASVGTLAVGILHEINNPLQWIMSNLSFIKDKLKNFHPGPKNQQLIQEFNNLLNESIQGAENISEMVKNLKGFVHNDEIKLIPVNIHEALNTAIKIASLEIQQHASLEKYFSNDIPTILMPNNQIQQVFLNLLINAAQAFPKDRNKADNVIKIKTAIEKDKIRIDIIDNGEVITPANLPKIFEPFFTTKPVGIGTGLGLAICYNIIHSVGGTISVQSDENHGTVFTIYLQLQIKAPLSGIEETKYKSTNESRLKILIVDDEPILLKTMRRLLMDDYDVTEALGGRAALNELERNANKFDLIITDLNMPDVNGVDLYRYIIQKHYHLHNRVIFITGGSLISGSDEFFAGINNLRIKKPFTREDLLKIISKFQQRECVGV